MQNGTMNHERMDCKWIGQIQILPFDGSMELKNSTAEPNVGSRPHLVTV
jgi:hypothetical protein